MTDRETWWLMAVTMAASLPDGWLRAAAVAASLLAMVTAAMARAPPAPHPVVVLPTLRPVRPLGTWNPEGSLKKPGGAHKVEPL